MKTRSATRATNAMSEQEVDGNNVLDMEGGEKGKSKKGAGDGMMKTQEIDKEKGSEMNGGQTSKADTDGTSTNEKAQEDVKSRQSTEHPVSNNSGVAKTSSKVPNGLKKPTKKVTMTPKSEFIYFPKLPFEIREIIWKLAIPGPRLIKIKHDPFPKKHGEYSELVKAGKKRNRWFWRARANGGPVPAMLHVDSQSRTIALKHFELAFKHQTIGRPVYVHFEHDTIIFWGQSAIHAFYGRPLRRFWDDDKIYEGRGDSQEKIRRMVEMEDKIRHLAIRTTCLPARKHSLAVARFEKIRNLAVISHERSWTFWDRIELFVLDGWLESNWISAFSSMDFRLPKVKTFESYDMFKRTFVPNTTSPSIGH